MGGTVYKKDFSYNEKGLLMNIKTFYDKHPEPLKNMTSNMTYLETS